MTHEKYYNIEIPQKISNTISMPLTWHKSATNHKKLCINVTFNPTFIASPDPATDANPRDLHWAVT